MHYAGCVKTLHSALLKGLQVGDTPWFSIELDDPVHGRITRFGRFDGEPHHRRVVVGDSSERPVETPGAGWIFAERYEGGAPLGGYVAATIVLRHGDGDAWVEGEANSQHTAALEALLSDARETAAEARDGGPGDLAARQLAESNHDGDEAHAGLTVQWRHDDASYLERIGACVAAVSEDGGVRCLTNMATVTAPAPFDPVSVSEALTRSSAAPRAAIIVEGDVALVSASPETFVACASGVVETEPMKGTRPRGATPEADEALREELRSSEKERQENLAVTERVVAELDAVCASGSVHVARPCVVKSYGQVHQLVSEVRGQLLESATLGEVLDAMSPAASMTGVPKATAVRHLAELEDGPRGLYSGCYGWVSVSGADAQVAMAIRCAELRGSTALVGAGGGLTAASRPDEELAEVKLKARAVLKALGAGYPRVL